ncbi:MAG: helix-turn-helix domain-containing protein [Candidatus Doudnabacteria bacterium]
MKVYLKQKALKLRKEGWSYSVIKRRTGVPKSTLSNWLGNLPYRPNSEVRKSMKEGPLRSAVMRRKAKIRNTREIKTSAARELGKLSKRDKWMLGLGIYMGEGSKTHDNIRVINSNPEIIKSAVKWFRGICDVPLENFAIRVHSYPDINEKESKAYWSKVSGIPLSQFFKNHIDTRTNKSALKKHKLQYGTAHLIIKSCGKIKFGVILHRRIMGWIEEVYNQMRV